MSSSWSNLKFELIATGEQSGTWGVTTDSNLGTAIEESITGSATVTFSSADVTITLTNTTATQAARNFRLYLTGTTGGAKNLILGSGCQISKPYLVYNNCADAITVKNTTGTGVAVPAGKQMWLYNNGTNVIEAISYFGSLVAGANTWTGLQTFSGSTTNLATVLANAKEPVTISATAATGTINFDITTQSIVYYTSNASSNWTVNFRGNSTNTLNSLMSTGESVTTAFLVPQGATAYYNSSIQVDSSAPTVYWQGNAAPTGGNASSLDIYSYTVIKTGSATFTVLASQIRFV